MANEKTAAETWAAALAEIKLQMTAATFDTWIRGSWVSEQAGSEWTIALPNAFALDWVSNRLANVITRTLARVAGEAVSVRFVVGTRPAPAAEERAEDLEDVPAADESGPVLEAVREERVTVGAGGALVWTDFYIKLKVAFRKRALKKLKGARLSVFLCLSLHVDRNGIAKPGGIEAIMHETGYSRGAVCSALGDLESAGLIRKARQHHGADQYEVRGYAWFGQEPAPSLWEVSKYKK